MLDPLFKEAFCHRLGGHTVLGRKLHPFCAFDILTLESIDSPFLKPGALCEIYDLVLVVWILSNPVAQDLTISHMELDAAGETWLKEIGPTIDMERDVAAVSAYMNDYYSAPEIMAGVDKKTPDELGAPWILSAVIGIVSKLHISLYAAWTMGIGQLMWYRGAIFEMEVPDLRIINDELRARLKEVEKGPVIFQLEPGEDMPAFAKRVGISEWEAANLLAQGKGA